MTCSIVTVYDAPKKQIISSLQRGGQSLNGHRSHRPQTDRRQILHAWEISVAYDYYKKSYALNSVKIDLNYNFSQKSTEPEMKPSKKSVDWNQPTTAVVDKIDPQ